MNIFAIDSAKQTLGIAIRQNNKLIYESYAALSVTHSQTLLPLCEAAFLATGLTPKLIDLYAITKGPGSFTGLRIGIGLIKGLAFAQNTPCVGISTLKALAQSISGTGYIAATLNARRNNVYCALFYKCDGKLTRITSDELLHKDEFYDKVLQICKSRNCTQRVTCVGDGALMFEGDMFLPVDDDYIMGKAGAITQLAQIASQNSKTVLPQNLAADYLLLTQAERALLGED